VPLREAWPERRRGFRCEGYGLLTWNWRMTLREACPERRRRLPVEMVWITCIALATHHTCMRVLNYTFRVL